MTARGNKKFPKRRENDMDESIKFAEVEAGKLAYIVAMGIDRHVVSGKEEATIRAMLDLDVRPNWELTAVRNTVVREYGDAMHVACDAHDWKTFDALSTAMSATTAVIDGVLWRRGALY